MERGSDEREEGNVDEERVAWRRVEEMVEVESLKIKEVVNEKASYLLEYRDAAQELYPKKQ